MLRKCMIQTLQLLGILGVSPEIESQVIYMYTTCGLWSPEGWPNTTVHCARVAQVGMELMRLAERPDNEIADVIFAGLVHDARKSAEKAQIAVLVEGGMSEDDAYTQASAEQAQWLLEFGIPSDIVTLSGLSGHNSLGVFLPQLPDCWPALAFHVADDLCGGQYGDEVVMLADRIEQLPIRYKWMINRPKHLRGSSWIEAQSMVSSRILDNIASLTVYRSGEALNAWLVGRLNCPIC